MHDDGIENSGSDRNGGRQGLTSRRKLGILEIVNSPNHADRDGLVAVHPSDTDGTGLRNMLNQTDLRQMSIFHQNMFVGNVEIRHDNLFIAGQHIVHQHKRRTLRNIRKGGYGVHKRRLFQTAFHDSVTAHPQILV